MKILKQRDKFLALADQVMVSGTNFTLGILITRFIGITDYGMFALYWMIFLFLQGLCNAYIGLPTQVLSQGRSDKQFYLEANNKLGQWIALGTGVVLFIGFYINHLVGDQAFGYGYWLFPVIIPLFLKHEMNRKYFYAIQATHKVFIIDFCVYFLQLPVMIGLIYFQRFDLNAALVILAFFSGLGQLVFWGIKVKRQKPFSLKELPLKENWTYAKHLLSTAILQWFSGNILLVSAAGIIGVGAVGVIRVLQNIMGVVHVLFLTMENVVPVKAAYLLNNGGKKLMMTYFKKVAIVTGICYGILLLLLKIFSADLLQLLYGPSYVEYAYLLDLFIGVYILIFIGTVAQIMIKTMRLNYGILLAYICTVIVAGIIASPLLKSFGVEGVIIGFGLLQIIALSIYFFTLKRVLA